MNRASLLTVIILILLLISHCSQHAGGTTDTGNAKVAAAIFTEDGDPIKCAVIVKISDTGEFEFYQQVCP